MAELDHVAWAALASIVRLTRAFSWARVREWVRRAIASPRPGASGMCCDLVRAEMGAWDGALTGATFGFGEAVGVLDRTTLRDAEGVVVGTILGDAGGFWMVAPLEMQWKAWVKVGWVEEKGLGVWE